MSGWTAATLHGNNNELLEGLVTEYYPEDGSGYAERTIQLPRSCDHESQACILVEQFGMVNINYITIVSANDTSDSGYGTVWAVTEESYVEKIDEKQGYEGAKGRDVIGYIDQEYGLSSYASFEA